MNRDLATLGRYQDLGQAQRDKLLLEAAGIPAFLAGENSASAGYAGVLGELRLQVLPADVERARRVLTEHEGFSPLPDDFVPPEAPPTELVSPDKTNTINTIVTVVVVAALMSVLFLLRDWNRRSFTGTRTRDLNHDQRADEWAHYENGHLASFEKDRNFDGKPDEWGRYRDGAAVRRELDQNFDGRPDVWFTYDNGVALHEDIDSDFDGVPDLHAVYLNGVLAAVDWYGKDGNVFRHETYLHGRRHQEFLDEDRDGWFEKCITYDALNLPLRTETVHEAVPPPRVASQP